MFKGAVWTRMEELRAVWTRVDGGWVYQPILGSVACAGNSIDQGLSNEGMREGPRESVVAVRRSGGTWEACCVLLPTAVRLLLHVAVAGGWCMASPPAPLPH